MTFFKYEEQLTDYQHLNGGNSYPLRYAASGTSEGKSANSQVVNGLILHQRTCRKVAPCVVSFNLKMRKR